MSEEERAQPQRPDEIRNLVSERYAQIAKNQGAGCCCGCGPQVSNEAISQNIGYSVEQLKTVPEGANLGLGCGNPTAIDSLKPGEVVVDLGSGAGLDAFIASRQVGPEGRVIGVDMTDDMLEKARENARRDGITNVEFRKGQIEDLPVEDQSVDVIISNCVVNLSPEKSKAFGEAFRVLRPGGRLMISDVVLERPLPDAVRESIDAYVGCVAGASLRQDYLRTIEEAGFEAVEVVGEASFSEAYLSCCSGDADIETFANQFGIDGETLTDLARAVTSVNVLARRPG